MVRSGKKMSSKNKGKKHVGKVKKAKERAVTKVAGYIITDRSG